MPPLSPVLSEEEEASEKMNGCSATTMTSPPATIDEPLNAYVAVRYESPRAGYGCRARRTIPKHTLIHVEEPLLKGHQIHEALRRHRTGRLPTRQDDERYLRTECGLSDADVESLFEMHDQYSPNEKRLAGILSSNAFQNAELGHAYRLYRRAARFNHGCRPNVGYDFDGWTIRMYTTRPVEEGEALTTCYSDVVYHFDRERRRSYLRGAMRFDCGCEACHPSSEEEDEKGAMVAMAKIQRSDEGRRRLKEIARELTARLGPARCPLYDAVFCMSVAEHHRQRAAAASASSTSSTSAAVSCPEETGTTPAVDIEQRRQRLLAKARRRQRSREIPVGHHDLTLLAEYRSLLEREGMDHDLLPVHELGFDLAVGVGCPTAAAEWAAGALELVRLAKGDGHPKTAALVAKMEPHVRSK